MRHVCVRVQNSELEDFKQINEIVRMVVDVEVDRVELNVIEVDDVIVDVVAHVEVLIVVNEVNFVTEVTVDPFVNLQVTVVDFVVDVVVLVKKDNIEQVVHNASTDSNKEEDVIEVIISIVGSIGVVVEVTNERVLICVDRVMLVNTNNLEIRHIDLMLLGRVKD